MVALGVILRRMAHFTSAFAEVELVKILGGVVRTESAFGMKVYLSIGCLRWLLLKNMISRSSATRLGSSPVGCTR